MKQIVKIALIVTISFFLVGWSFGEKKPKNGELENAFEMELPEYVQLSNFDVEVLENMGNKVDPRWGSRFKAIIKTKIPLYEQDQKDKKNKITFVILKNEKNTKTEVYGKIISTIYQGKWKHAFDIEGRPIYNLGFQLNSFNDRVLVRGSNEEKAFFKRQRELAKQKAKEKAEFEAHIAKSEQIFVGTWRTTNWWDRKNGKNLANKEMVTVVIAPDKKFQWRGDDGYYETGIWWVRPQIKEKDFCYKTDKKYYPKRHKTFTKPNSVTCLDIKKLTDNYVYAARNWNEIMSGKKISPEAKILTSSAQASLGTKKHTKQIGHGTSGTIDGIWAVYWDNNTTNTFDIKIINLDTVTGFYTNDSHDQCPVNGKFNNDSSIKMEIHCPKWSNKVTVTGIVQKGSKKITGSYLINNISGSFYMRKQI